MLNRGEQLSHSLICGEVDFKSSGRVAAYLDCYLVHTTCGSHYFSIRTGASRILSGPEASME